ncbi:MAG: hypothetical protein R6W79_02320 [Acidimicrobiia bacterium]
MRRVIPILAVVLALAASACGASTDPAQSDEATTSVAPTTSTQSDSQAPPGEEPAGTTTVPEASEDRPEGPVAPDFTLALGADGAETFVLSQEVKPVFMVFWAEW